jgi:predicted metal-dependent HD superfamily phosphohydrolase
MLPRERERMQAGWMRLLHACCNAPAETRQAAFYDLAARYSTADRHYHNLDHIRAVLETVEGIGAPARNPAALELAIWYHDIIYDSQAADNEEKSAEHARVVLGRLGAPPAIPNETARLILLTKTHQANTDDTDGRMLLDADLSVLGADEGEYDHYAAAIRREYAWVAEDAYRAGRRRVLEGFLRRPRIYETEALFARLEEGARRNLHREIAALGGDGE